MLGEHKKIALQFSGGKDSLATLIFMKPYWKDLTVYHLDSGDQYPETIELVKKVENTVPNFVRVQGRQKETIESMGIPSDIVPTSATWFGNMIGHGNVRINDRYSCCYNSIMLPMYERMVADGITLIIRGQKNADDHKPPLRSGDVLEGVEYLYPVEEWTHAETLEFIAENGWQVPQFYEMLNTSPDCMTCSAWWDDGRAQYLKKYHPESFVEYQRRLGIIEAEVKKHVIYFNVERGAQNG